MCFSWFFGIFFVFFISYSFVCSAFRSSTMCKQTPDCRRYRWNTKFSSNGCWHWCGIWSWLWLCSRSQSKLSGKCLFGKSYNYKKFEKIISVLVSTGQYIGWFYSFFENYLFEPCSKRIVPYLKIRCYPNYIFIWISLNRLKKLTVKSKIQLQWILMCQLILVMLKKSNQAL